MECSLDEMAFLLSAEGRYNQSLKGIARRE